jgi:hypothetical protein
VAGGKCAFRIRRRLVLRLDIGKNNLTKKFQIPRALLTHPFPKYKRGKIDFFAREKSGPKRIQQIQMVRLKREKNAAKYKSWRNYRVASGKSR